MKTYNIYKSWYLMSQEEQKEFLEDDDLLDCYLDNHNEDINTYDEDDFEEYCQEINDEYFDDDFGDYGNWKCSPLANQKVAVIGSLGLWDGTKKIYPEVFENLQKAVYACLEDYNNIYEDQYGNLHIEAHHHDGTNYILFKELKSNVDSDSMENDLIWSNLTPDEFEDKINFYTKSLRKYFKGYLY